MPVSKSFQILFGVIIILNIIVWIYARPLQVEWRNVPKPPGDFGLHAAGLGDTNLAYRSIGFMLQNIGKVDGRTQSLRDYNYDDLIKWFYKAYELEQRANYVPMLAAFYFGATSNPDDARKVVEFLKISGNDATGDRWRWLVHGIFLARHKVEDLDLAYEVAEILAKLDAQNMPAWTRMMPAFIQNSKGEKEDAYNMLSSMLATSSDTLHPAEINHIIGYICEDILSDAEAAKDSICELNKP